MNCLSRLTSAKLRLTWGNAFCHFLSALVVATLLLNVTRPAWADEGKSEKFSVEQIEFFEKQVEPILKSRCFKCHGGEERLRGGLKLTTRAGVLKGGEIGPVISLDKPAESLILKAINYQGPEMPPSGKLPPNEIETLTQWVREGLPVSPARLADADDAKTETKPVETTSDYWAYQPIRQPLLPAVKQSHWVRNPIDAFILEKLEAKGIPQNQPAAPAELIRRATYDLTGLPPRPEEIDAFVKASQDGQAEQAYLDLIDRLLESPQYGERWGRHWLDLVRFAETHGYERDSAKPFAWRYRDYVIAAFNADKPYDQFLREQLAGDELDQVTTESMIATGYYRLGIWDDEPADRPLAKYDVLDGIVSTTSQVMLGMSLGCARCHDHKKDPLPQKDYYRLLAYFRDVTDMNVANLRRVALDDDHKKSAELIASRMREEQAMYRQLAGLRSEFANRLQQEKGIRVGRAGGDLVDLSFKFYRDTWSTLPDFDSLKAEESGVLPHGFFTLSVASRTESMGIVFSGKLQVPQDGEYYFRLHSTEGVRLIINGKTVFERPGKGRHRGEAKVPLQAGLVPIRLEYFNAVAQPVLRVNWSGPGVQERSLTDSGSGVLSSDSRLLPQEWYYTFEAPKEEWPQSDFDDSTWKRGPGGFGLNGTPGAVVRTEWKTGNIWLRRKFNVQQMPDRISLDIHHDDGVDVWLNGTRVYIADGFLVTYEQRVLPQDAAKLLRVGENTLAVHCVQTVGGQYIDVGVSEAPESAVLDSLRKEYGPTLLGDKMAEWDRLQEAITSLKQAKLPEPGIEVMCVEERGREQTHVLIRGNPQALGDPVEAAPPAVACGGRAIPAIEKNDRGTSGKRLALANWITHQDNPLTSRVMMNRLWQYHFGRGIVPTPNDFGKLGEEPTHPELLDWLARAFVASGWKVKAMHRLIMTSNTYRMSSHGSAPGLARDAGNQLFWRYNMRRLSAEEIRDSILQVTGALRLTAGGPGVYPPIPREVLAGQSVPGSGWGNSPPEEANRRSVYVHVKRSLIVPILSQYDLADTDSSCPIRYTTTVPTQALGMLNGAFTNEQAVQLASRLQKEHPSKLSQQIVRGIRLTTGRIPSPKEIARDEAFIQKLITEKQQTPENALKAYCLVLLGANEFIYVD